MYTTGWRRRPPECKYKHGTDLYGLAVEQTSLLGNIHPALKQACSIFINSPIFFCIEVALCSYKIVFVWFIFMVQECRLSKCECHLSCDPSIPWLFCSEKERPRPILHFMSYCVKQATRQTGGRPDVSSPWTRHGKPEAPKLIWHNMPLFSSSERNLEGC